MNRVYERTEYKLRSISLVYPWDLK